MFSKKEKKNIRNQKKIDSIIYVYKVTEGIYRVFNCP